MTNHTFRPTTAYVGAKRVFKVTCKMGGEFSTALWLKGKVPNQICPCCNERVKRGK